MEQAASAAEVALPVEGIADGWINFGNIEYKEEPFRTWDAWWKEAQQKGNKWAHNMVLLPKFTFANLC